MSSAERGTAEDERTDLLGNPLTPCEREVLQVYEALKRLATRADTPPCVQANTRLALAAAWQMVNDLDLVFEEVPEI